MSVVVSDTSPLHALNHLGHLEILTVLYGEVLVPPAVSAELLNPAAGLPQLDVNLVPGIRIVAPSDTSQFDSPALKLDPGETEALALAVELKAGLILIDEKRGRAAAIAAGLRPVGVLGTLADAKDAGLISAIAPLIDRLVNEIGFRISATLREHILRRAGEPV
jgi:predicted nucleic acid-binding protein